MKLVLALLAVIASVGILASLVLAFSDNESKETPAVIQSISTPTESAASPADTATPETAEATPAPTATPESAPASPGAVLTSLSASCKSEPDGAVITINYSVASVGSNLRRVKLVQDGEAVEDSGPLDQKEYRRIATFKVPYGTKHSYRLEIEAPGPTPAGVSSSVQCGGAPPEATPAFRS